MDDSHNRGAPVSKEALDKLFLEARTQNGFTDQPVPIELVRKAFEIARMGPTSANCQPMRLVLVQSQDAKERLKPALSPGNTDKTMAAPLTAIIAYDLQFYEYLTRMFPHNKDMGSVFAQKPDEERLQHAFRNGSLQGAYFMICLRALGLGVGPMSGFDNARVDTEFFPDGRFKSNWLCNIGYGDPSKVFERSPRFEFDEIASVI